jgi:hypothetical protein
VTQSWSKGPIRGLRVGSGGRHSAHSQLSTLPKAQAKIKEANRMKIGGVGRAMKLFSKTENKIPQDKTKTIKTSMVGSRVKDKG